MIGRLPALMAAPLWERLRRGEGGLLAANAAFVAFARPPLLAATAQVALSGLVLAVLYAVNDLRDAEGDRRNPKKNQGLVSALLEQRRPFFLYLCGLQIALAILAFAALGSSAAVAVVAMFAVNFAYSWGLKGVPFADMLVVGVWGATYAAIVSPPWRVCLAVGLMTSMMHVFQTLGDRDVDAANRVTTTAVRSPRAASAALLALSLALALALYGPLGPVGSLSALAPLILFSSMSNTAAAWMASRVYCGMALLAMLRAIHGFP